MLSLFEELLKNLGNLLNISLKPDHLNACTLKVDDSLLVQLKIDKTEKYLFLGSSLTEVPPGKFRENVFTQTLIANAKIPRIGSFAFQEKDSSLFLFAYLPLEYVEVTTLKNKLAQFVEKAMEWKEAIESGSPAPLEFLKEKEPKKPPFI